VDAAGTDTGASDAALASLAQPGCYSLVFTLQKKTRIRVGRLGTANFPSGIYIYTGSALGGLKSRLRCHLCRRKKLRWHIDYLLNSPAISFENILIYPATPGEECRQNQRIAALPGARIVMPRFGASDCTAGCASHLVFFSQALLARMIAGRAVLDSSLLAKR
jgi:Uri superfamily endonuclease